MNTKILIGPSRFAVLDKTPLKRLIEKGFQVIDNPYKRKISKQELLCLLPGVQGLIAGLETLDQEVLEKSQLKVISRCGAGMSNVDLEAAERFGIEVFSTPFGPTNAVAELTMACLISLLRELPQIDRSMHMKKWDKRIGVELRGKKVVVIGFGRIGQRVGQFLSAFGAEVFAVDPVYDNKIKNFKKLNIDEALKVGDVIILHSSGTEVLLKEEEFEIIKKGVFILNAARGELIEETALIKALRTGQVAGAWLDTYSVEPYNGPLTDFEQVILTPHIGSYTFECRLAMETEAVENLIKGLDGKQE